MDRLLAPLSWVDDQLARALPLGFRVVLWAAAAAFVSMEIYRILSPQERIRGVEAAMREARARLDTLDDDFAAGWAVVREALALSVKRLGLVAPAAIAASLPLFALVWWMSHAYRDVRILEVGPAWAAGWQLPFFVSLSASAFATKALRHIA